MHGDRLGDVGMRVAERADRDPGDHVEIAVSVRVDQLATFAADDLDGRARVVGEQVTLAGKLFANGFHGRDDRSRRPECAHVR